MMDDPRHARIRRLVSATGSRRARCATSRTSCAVARGALLDAVPTASRVDFLVDVAAELPMQTICILLGVPEDDRHELCGRGRARLRLPRPATRSTASASRRPPLRHARVRHALDRREASATRADDMLSVVVHATLADEDPPRLTDVELYMFFSPAVRRRLARPPATRSPAACSRCSSIPTSSPRSAPIPTLHGHRDRGDAALDVAVAVEATHRHARRRARRSRDRAGRQGRWSGRARRTATSSRSRRAIDVRRRAATRTRTSASVTACTSASAPTSPGSRCG